MFRSPCCRSASLSLLSSSFCIEKGKTKERSITCLVIRHTRIGTFQKFPNMSIPTDFTDSTDFTVPEGDHQKFRFSYPYSLHFFSKRFLYFHWSFTSSARILLGNGPRNLYIHIHQRFSLKLPETTP